MADFAASVQGVALRLSRLDLTGAITSTIVTGAFTRVSFTPEYEEGEEITEKNAAGAVCVTYKAPDSLKRVSLEVAICTPDPAITELIQGGTLLGTVGYAAPLIGVEANPGGCAVEVFSYAVEAGKRASVNPYFHWVFPSCQLRLTGDRVIENGLLATVFSGNGVGNSAFGTGGGTPAWAFGSDRAYQYARVAAAPAVGPAPVVTP